MFGVENRKDNVDDALGFDKGSNCLIDNRPRATEPTLLVITPDIECELSCEAVEEPKYGVWVLPFVPESLNEDFDDSKSCRDEEPVAKSMSLVTITSCGADLEKANNDDSLDEDKPGTKSKIFDVISRCNVHVESGRDDQGIFCSANELIGLADATSFNAAFFRGSVEEDKGNDVEYSSICDTVLKCGDFDEGRPLWCCNEDLVTKSTWLVVVSLLNFDLT